MNGVLFWFSLVIKFFFGGGGGGGQGLGSRGGAVVRAPTKVAEFESCCHVWIQSRFQGLSPMPPLSLG